MFEFLGFIRDLFDQFNLALSSITLQNTFWHRFDADYSNTLNEWELSYLSYFVNKLTCNKRDLFVLPGFSFSQTSILPVIAGSSLCINGKVYYEYSLPESALDHYA